MFAIQKETVGREACLPKTDMRFVLVDDFTVFGQLDAHAVKLWLVDAPQLNCAKIIQCQVVVWLTVRSELAGFASNDSGPVVQLRSQLKPVAARFAFVEITTHSDASVWAKHSNWLRKNIFNEDVRHHAQGDVTIDSPKREVIDLAAKRRNIFPLCRVNLDRQHVVALLPIEVRRQLKRKGCVAAAIFAKSLSVDPYGRSCHDPAEINKHSALSKFNR